MNYKESRSVLSQQSSLFSLPHFSIQSPRDHLQPPAQTSGSGTGSRDRVVELSASTAELRFFSRRGSGGCGPGLFALKKLLLLLQLGAALSSRAHAILGRLPESQPRLSMSEWQPWSSSSPGLPPWLRPLGRGQWPVGESLTSSNSHFSLRTSPTWPQTVQRIR